MNISRVYRGASNDEAGKKKLAALSKYHVFRFTVTKRTAGWFKRNAAYFLMQ
jgi:hypothetical protein